MRTRAIPFWLGKREINPRRRSLVKRSDLYGRATRFFRIASENYVYAMKFDGDHIRHMTKISLQQLDWV